MFSVTELAQLESEVDKHQTTQKQNVNSKGAAGSQDLVANKINQSKAESSSVREKLRALASMRTIFNWELCPLDNIASCN